MKTRYEAKIKELENYYKGELETLGTWVSLFLSTEDEFFDPFSRSVKQTREHLLSEMERVRKVAMMRKNALENKPCNLECEAQLDSIIVSQGGMDMTSLLKELHKERVKIKVAEIGRQRAIDVFKCFWPGLSLTFLYNQTDCEYRFSD